MNLELKHLAPYLPYGLRLVYLENTVNEYFTMTSDRDNDLAEFGNISIEQSLEQSIYKCKPILRPLSDLTPRYADAWGISSLKHLIRYIEKKDVPMHIYLELLEGHFDVFGLIDNDLAIDINTINS